MKIRLKGFRSLIKAVQNRAHLFPVKVLVNGKTKTYYSIRYKTGNKAMEIARKQMRIPNNAEILFDSIDGKKKNLTENDVLKIYDKAGKPGSLQEFIKANFKKPIIKPKNSTIVSLKNQQLSIDDLMQGDNKNNNKEASDKEKTEKLWQEFEKWRVKAGEDLSYIVSSYNKNVEDMTPADYRKIMENLFKGELARGYTQLGKTIDECLENYIQKFKDKIKDKEDRKNAWNDEYYKEIYSHLEQMYRKGDWLFELDAKKYLRQFSSDKVGLDRYAANNAGKAALKDILEKNGEDKKKEKNKESESGITITGPIYDDDERPTYYINDNGNVIETQDTKIVEQYRQKQKETESQAGTDYKDDNSNNKNPDKENKNKQNEDKKNAWNDDYYNEVYDTLEQMYKKNDGTFVRDAAVYLRKFVSSKFGNDRYAAENVVKAALNDMLANNIGTNKKEKELSPEDIVKLTYRLGTKKIESKNEYQKQNSVDSLVESIKPLKDKHTDIKGRAIMDMFGIDLPLYSKRNARTFGLRGRGAVGVCRYNIDFDGSRENKEICLVADRGNPAAETKTAIHECMHAKISDVVSTDLRNLGFGVGRRRASLGMLEETLVETAGQALGNLIHGKETDKGLYSYVDQVASYLPIIWGAEDFDKVRKNGIHGLGKEIAEQLMANNSDFLTSILDEFDTYKKDPIVASRYKALDAKIQERTDKVQKIQEDTGISAIGDLVEELKRGTISLEVALNSSKYRKIAAVLITKFLEDEDLDVLEGMALSF